MARKDRLGPNADPQLQAKLRDRDKRIEGQRRADLTALMARPDFRRFMYDLVFERCGLLHLYPGADSGIYRHEGGRKIGFDLAQELQQAHADDYLRMIAEQVRDQENERKLTDAAHTASNKGDEDA